MARRKPKDERRREIAGAVIKIIGTKGFASLTTASLAAEVGVTTGALFRHFDSLDDTLREAVQLCAERLDATFPDRSLPPRERLMLLARRRVEAFRSEPGIAWFLRSEQSQLALPEDAVAVLQSLVRRSRRYLLEAVREGAAEGTIRADIEPETLLVPIMGTIQALAGMPGVHRLTPRADNKKREAVLSALERMITPTPPERRRGRKKETRT